MRARAPAFVAPSAAALVAAAFVVAILAPRPAAARMQATLEFGGGASIPLSKYIDVEGNDGRHVVENGPHGALNLALLFGNWQFRYAASWISLGRAEVRIPAGYVQDYRDVKQVVDNLPNAVTNILKVPALPDVGVKRDVDDTLAFHSFTFGYRFYFLRGRWQPYMPLEIGAAVVTSDYLTRTLYGLTLSTGVGLDVRLWEFLYAGLSVRYGFYLTETDQSIAAVGLAGGSDLFDSSVAMAHIIAASVQLQARY